MERTANGGTHKSPECPGGYFGVALSICQELLVTLIMLMWLWLKAIVLFFVPTRFIAKDITGQRVLITGAGGVMGSLLAQKFASAGCDLVLWDIDEIMNQRTERSLQQYNVKVTTYTVDVSDRETINQTAKQIEEELGHIDILINNAGIVFGNRVFVAKAEDMVKTFHVNCMAHFWTVKAFVPNMVRRNSGHLVTVASSAAFLGVPGMADYCSSKSAIVGFEETFRLELASTGKTGVKTTLVCPYQINTGMFEGCKARFPLVMDSLQPEYVADKILDAVLREQQMILMPKQIYLLMALKSILPIECQTVLSDYLGVTTFMSTFTGNHSKKD